MKLEDKEYEIIEKYERDYFCYYLIKNNGNYYFLKKANNSDSMYIGSLNNEANVIKKINCNKIPQIISSKENEYILYEFVDGRLLKDIKNIDINNVLLIIISLLKILSKVHESGFVHNDLKTGNIIVGKDNKIYLMDFGNATIIGGTPKFGSLDVSSPELLLKKSVDTRSDIYSVGIILYELITGIDPFEGLIRDKLIELKIKGVPLLDYRKDINDQLNFVIQKATASNMNKRYNNVQEMANDINNLLVRIQSIDNN